MLPFRLYISLQAKKINTNKKKKETFRTCQVNHMQQTGAYNSRYLQWAIEQIHN